MTLLMLMTRGISLLNMVQTEIYNNIAAHYKENYDRMVGFCNKFLKSTERAEDVVQETYTRALTYWESAPDAANELAPWLQGILNNCIRENWKTEMQHGMSLSDEEAENIPTRSSQVPAVILSQVERSISEQHPDLARILRLHFIDGYTSKEIAEMVPDTANAIRVAVHRFRNMIKEEFRWVI
jgi:RNA polymerase sigma factor (sigma-70 family)